MDVIKIDSLEKLKFFKEGILSSFFSNLPSQISLKIADFMKIKEENGLSDSFLAIYDEDIDFSNFYLDDSFFSLEPEESENLVFPKVEKENEYETYWVDLFIMNDGGDGFLFVERKNL